MHQQRRRQLVPWPAELLVRWSARMRGRSRCSSPINLCMTFRVTTCTMAPGQVLECVSSGSRSVLAAASLRQIRSRSARAPDRRLCKYGRSSLRSHTSSMHSV